VKSVFLVFKDAQQKAQWLRRLKLAIIAAVKQRRAKDVTAALKGQVGARGECHHSL
jgi:hypothetical protein